MAVNKARYGYLKYDDIQKRIDENILDQYDVIFTKDTHEAYILDEDLNIVPVIGRVYTYSSIEDAENNLNSKSDTYVGQIIAIEINDKFSGYIVNQKNGIYYVTSLNESDDPIDYNNLINVPIINIRSNLEDQIIISEFTSGYYKVSGEYKIDRNDSTVYLNPVETYFIVEHIDNTVYIKQFSGKNISYYTIQGENIIYDTVATISYLQEQGYVIKDELNLKIESLKVDIIQDSKQYIEDLIQSDDFNKMLDDKVDTRINKIIKSANSQQIIDLFS